MENNYTTENEDENFLFLPDKKNSFATPDTYFDSLASRISNKLETAEELSTVPALAAVSKQLLFTVPKNYFQQNENLLSYKLELASLPELSKVKQTVLNPLSEEYLAQLEKNIIHKIELHKELKSYSVLSALQKENNFALNEEYFESLADTVKERIHAAPVSRISILEQLISVLVKPRVVFAYSMVFVLIAASVWYFNSSTGAVNTGDCKTLACLEKNELLNEKNINDFDEDNLYEMVDVNALDKRLSEKDLSDSVLKEKENK